MANYIDDTKVKYVYYKNKIITYITQEKLW